MNHRSCLPNMHIYVEKKLPKDKHNTSMPCEPPRFLRTIEPSVGDQAYLRMVSPGWKPAMPNAHLDPVIKDGEKRGGPRVGFWVC